jgi:tetratricopeptide (TPR) repeat protein
MGTREPRLVVGDLATPDRARVGDGQGAAVPSAPQSGDAFYNQGNACHKKGEFEQAASAYRRALELNSRDADSWNNLGKTFKELNRLDEAIAAYDRALDFRPDLAVAHCNRAIALLASGRLEEGLREYEWRWRLFTPRGYTKPLWDGAALPGGTLFIHAEQGLGDAIQFVRFVALARAKAARVILECHAPLKGLFEYSRCADAYVVVGETPPPFDCYLPLMSLPRVFGTALGLVSPQIPYLQAPPFEGEFPAVAPGLLKVGVAWAGNPGHENDSARSLRLEELALLFQIPGITFFNLQMPVPPHDEVFLRSGNKLMDAGLERNDFRRTAAAIAQMDLLISADTAVAHLAGALGKPVWTFLQHSPDWRWLLNRGDTPWHPTMRLFRQPKRGDWQSPVRRVADELNVLRRA